MEQIKKLTALVYQLIGGNQYIIGAIDSIKRRGNNMPSIELTYTSGCDYWPSANKIYIGLRDIIDCYDIAQRYEFKRNYQFQIDTDYYEGRVRNEKSKGMEFYMPMTESEREIVENMISKTQFLKGCEINNTDVITIFSLSYSLYHEIGHALNDPNISETKPIERELMADAFAFNAVKSMNDIENENILLLGTFVGVIQVLDKLSYAQEKKDERHPYTIERLYELLSFWDLSNNSIFWRFACDIVSTWCHNNNLSMEWNHNKSDSCRNKFIKAYNLFRRK